MPVRSGADSVDAAFLDACATIRALLAQAVREDLYARYRVGALLSIVKRAPSTYGEHAVERLGAELGIATATLYRYATVADCWSLEDVESQGTRTNRFGEPLSWSHFVALTRVPHPAARRALTEECRQKGWSVRKLTEVVTRLARAGENNDGAEASVRIALNEGIQSATRATVELDIFSEALATRLADLEEDADEALVERAITAFQELNVRAESTLSQLRGATRASEQRLRCAPAVRGEETAKLPDPFDDDALGEAVTEADEPRRQRRDAR